MNFDIHVLWNHSNSWGPVFVNYLHFAGSRGCHVSLCNWFVALQCGTIHYILKYPWGHKFVGKVNP